jgi:hypothetical protein
MATGRPSVQYLDLFVGSEHNPARGTPVLAPDGFPWARADAGSQAEGLQIGLNLDLKPVGLFQEREGISPLSFFPAEDLAGEASRRIAACTLRCAAESEIKVLTRGSLRSEWIRARTLANSAFIWASNGAPVALFVWNSRHVALASAARCASGVFAAVDDPPPQPARAAATQMSTMDSRQWRAFTSGRVLARSTRGV